MKTKELKKELEQYGIDTKGLFDKSEFVKAVAEARVDGLKKSYKTDASSNKSSTRESGFGSNTKPKEEPFDPSYRNVNVRKLGDETKAGLLLDGSVIDTTSRSDFQ